MKIFVNARFLTQPLSGVQRYAIECSLQIKKQYKEVIFLAPHGILHQDIAQELEVVCMGKYSGHLWEQIDLWLYMKGQKGAPLLHLCNTATYMHRHNYITIHDLAFYHHPEWNHPLFSKWYNWLMPKVARRSMHLFTVSNFIKDELHTIYNIPPNKIDITYNGICSYFIVKGNEPCKKKKMILAVGSFNKRKNQQMLINGFIASELYNEYQLVLFGDKNRVFAATNFNEEHLKKYNILITNSFSDEVLMQYYKDAALVVSLSTYEGFGIPVLEGLYFHSKVLCSDIPVYRELFKDIAVFCNPNDEVDVSTQLKYALEQTVEPHNEMLTQLMQKFNYASSAEVILNRIKQQL